MYLADNVELIRNHEKIIRVLDCLCEKMMKQRDTNEILALKFSYLSYLVKQAATFYKKQSDRTVGDSSETLLDPWIKLFVTDVFFL